MMTTRELIEYAALDALGLLEDHERDAFEAAFKQAPPHVQAHVRTEQRRFAISEEALLPDVEPPAGLRFKVLAAVRDAIRKSSPLHVNRERQKANQPMLLSLWSSAQAWRVAAIALVSAVIALSVITVNLASTQQEMQNSTQAQQNMEIWREVRERGGEAAAFLATPGVRSVNLMPDPEADAFDIDPVVNVLVDDANQRGALVCRHLPVLNGSYRLVILDDLGNIARELNLTVIATDQTQTVLLDSISLADASALAIVGPRDRNGQDEIIVAARFA